LRDATLAIRKKRANVRVLRLMTASHAPAAPLSVALQTAANAQRVKLVAAVVALLILATAGLMLALSLPGDSSVQPAHFLGPTAR
jgi:lysylphosphatidylglycerol synthetase-like protein (DUF2156 family)